LDNGSVYVSAKHTNKIFELLENDDDRAIQRLIDEGKAEKYESKDFRDDLKKDLEYDLEILKEIKRFWQQVQRDPKLIRFQDELSKNQILKNSHLIIFTESKETCDYLARNLENRFPNQVISFSGSSNAINREKVIENFDARARFPKDDYRILISTEVLSEGVNLHRSDVVINYDIPWNPTRLMQRVGRINRVDTAFDKIYTFNFFPTKQANSLIKLKEAAEVKIHAFMTLLGDDAMILTEGEPIGSHELFSRLTSKETITGESGEEESELKYLQIIKNIRDNNPDLFAQAKQLPKKSRTARKTNKNPASLLTYFRKGKLQKFFLARREKPQELDFISAARFLEATQDIKREKLGKDFYKLLDKNKKAFEMATIEEMPELKTRGGRDTATQVLKRLKAVKDFRTFTDDQELYLKKVMKELEEGGLPKQTTKKTLQALNKELKSGLNPLRILGVLQRSIPSNLLKEHIAESSAQTAGPREVILSEYFIKNN
jgi:superfamily II DNA/RNA helicase